MDDLLGEELVEVLDAEQDLFDQEFSLVLRDAFVLLQVVAEIGTVAVLHNGNE